jgi:hypothetical protein
MQRGGLTSVFPKKNQAEDATAWPMHGIKAAASNFPGVLAASRIVFVDGEVDGAQQVLYSAFELVAHPASIKAIPRVCAPPVGATLSIQARKGLQRFFNHCAYRIRIPWGVRT